MRTDNCYDALFNLAALSVAQSEQMTMDKTRTLSIVILLCLGLSIAQDVGKYSYFLKA